MTALAYVLKKDLRQTALAVLRLSVGKIPAIENRSDLVDQDARIIWSVQNILNARKRKYLRVLMEILKLEICYDRNVRIAFTDEISVANHAARFTSTELSKIDM